MKFLAVLVAALLAFSAPAEAAQKRIAVKKIEKIAAGFAIFINGMIFASSGRPYCFESC